MSGSAGASRSTLIVYYPAAAVIVEITQDLGSDAFEHVGQLRLASESDPPGQSDEFSFVCAHLEG